MQALSAELLAGPTALAAESARDHDDPDSEWVARWQAGDPRAFEVLVRRHERRVYRLLVRMLGSTEEAEDAAQEAFLSLHRHGKRFRREARFSTFVYRVAVNAALNRRRSQGRARARHEQLIQKQAAGEHLPSTPRDPESAASGAEVQERVQDALQQLPPDLRMAVILYDIEGQSYRDIASVLGIPEGTVKSRIHRARNALRDLLREFVRERASGDTP
ncbi:MAG TPA: sigma-70 family RNA polymerase sigma factor [Myxococcota bacterium]